MSFTFSTKKNELESADRICPNCGAKYTIYRDVSTSDSGPSLECAACSEVVIFTIWSMPDVQDLEKKHGPAKALKVVESMLPAHQGCGGKLIFSDSFTSGFPKHCPKCKKKNELTIHVVKGRETALVGKEMSVLGFHKK